MTAIIPKTAGTEARGSAPGALAPLIRNCWYVVAPRAEFERTPKQRWILGEPVCYYLTSDGTPVVLDDRCAHRRFPLSRSSLDGDAIVCGYHGFTYAPDGRCLRVPGGGDPGAVRVRSYPAVQRGPWVWIWTGSEPENADPSLIPWPDVNDADGDFVTGYALNPANYSMVHENLLDLSHIEFLHRVGEVGYDEVQPPELLSADELPERFVDSAVGFRHHYQGTVGLWGTPAGDDPALGVNRKDYVLSVTPGCHYGIIDFTPDDPEVMRLRRYTVTHCLTPANDASTHQFWTYWQNVPLVNGDDWKSLIYQFFQQDVDALGWIQEYVEADDRSGVVERSAAMDAAGLKLRRKLQRLAAQEAR